MLTALTAGTLLAALFSGATAAWWSCCWSWPPGPPTCCCSTTFAGSSPSGSSRPCSVRAALRIRAGRPRAALHGADFAAAVRLHRDAAARTWALAAVRAGQHRRLGPVAGRVLLRATSCSEDTAGHHGPNAGWRTCRQLRSASGSSPCAPSPFRHHRQRDGQDTVAAIAGVAPLAAANLQPAPSPRPARACRGRHQYTYRSWPGTPWDPSPPASAPVVRMAALNHIANPNLIYVGQVLQIGGSSSGGSGPSWGEPAGATYRVMAGDTLGSIPPPASAPRRPHWPPSTNRQRTTSTRGRSCDSAVRRDRADAAATATKAAMRPEACASGGTDRVAAGDILGSIAARFGTTWSALAAINHLCQPQPHLHGRDLRVSGSEGGSTRVTGCPCSTSPAGPAPAPPRRPQRAGAVAPGVALVRLASRTSRAPRGNRASFDCSGLVMYAWRMPESRYPTTAWLSTRTPSASAVVSCNQATWCSTTPGAGPSRATSPFTSATARSSPLTRRARSCGSKSLTGTESQWGMAGSASPSSWCCR